MPRPLLLADHVVFTCQSCGSCCRNDWLIGVDEASWERLRDVDWHEVDPGLPGGEKFRRLPLPLAGGETRTFARTPGGACVFLTEDRRCAIHRHLGHGMKPQICREFPYWFVETPDGVAVGLSFACTAVRGHHGRSLAEQEAEVRDVLAGSTRVGRVPDPIVLYSGIDIAWEEYRPIEAALLAVLGGADRSFAVSLIAGSILVNLCVSLVQVERRARTAGTTPAETLASGLVRLEGEGYDRLFEVATAVGALRRPSLAHLAPLHAWLRLSHKRMGPAALVVALYADYLRFRRLRGRVPDLITGGPDVALDRAARVRFAGSAEVDAFLREYYRHAISRKTLTPMHGVFRGYHTMLALYSFTRWAAKVAALQAGRHETTLPDVQEAVRLVEQRFVLHAQFGSLFSLSTVLTLLADRLFGAPAFAPAAVLETTAHDHGVRGTARGRS